MRNKEDTPASALASLPKNTFTLSLVTKNDQRPQPPALARNVSSMVLYVYG